MIFHSVYHLFFSGDYVVLIFGTCANQYAQFKNQKGNFRKTVISI